MKKRLETRITSALETWRDSITPDEATLAAMTPKESEKFLTKLLFPTVTIVTKTRTKRL